MIEYNPAVQLGSAYWVNTEDSPDQIRAGIGAMARAGLKLVRIFLQWTHVEPRQDRWDWSKYDAVFEAAAAGGLGVVVTLTALHPPGWMKISFGPQDLGPIDDPAYWERAMEYTRRSVARYAHHPALHSWILNNEPTLYLAQTEAVLRRYRRFVAHTCGGEIAVYNRRSFQQLDSFDEVSFEGGISTGPAGFTGQLYWLNFLGFRLQEVLAELQTVIRAGDDTHPVHVNPHGLVNDLYRQGQSIWAEGRLVDFMGCSAHPSWHSTRFLQDRLHQSVALFSDLMRGATRAPGRYFWVTELQGGNNIFSGLNYLGPTGADLRAWVWESIAAGAKAVVFWCFNYRLQGFEAGEWSLLDQQGRPSRRLAEVTEIAAFLERYRALFAASTPARAPVALLYSEATWKLGNVEGQGQDPENPRNLLMGADALAGAWMACADAGLSVDILDELDLQHGLAQMYPLLILPGCTALEDASLPALRAYVERGGTLLADGLCGYKDPQGWLRDVATNPLNDLFGASVGDIQAVPPGVPAELVGAGLVLPVWFLKVVLEPRPVTQVLASFNEADPSAYRFGYPQGGLGGATLAVRGEGRAIRLGTVFFQHYFRHPAPAAFAMLRVSGLLPLTPEPVGLENPSAALRLRRLDLPADPRQGGEAPGESLLVLLNSGSIPAAARLRLGPGLRLAHLSPAGEAPLDLAAQLLEISVPAQDSVIYRLYPAVPVGGQARSGS